jgi:hypothetical protein
MKARTAEPAAVNAGLEPWIYHAVFTLRANHGNTVEGIASEPVPANLSDAINALDTRATEAHACADIRAAKAIPYSFVLRLARLAVVEGALFPIIIPIARIIQRDHRSGHVAVAALAVASNLRGQSTHLDCELADPIQTFGCAADGINRTRAVSGCGAFAS